MTEVCMCGYSTANTSPRAVATESASMLKTLCERWRYVAIISVSDTFSRRSRSASAVNSAQLTAELIHSVTIWYARV